MDRFSNFRFGKPPTRVWANIYRLCLLSPALLGIGCETSRSDVTSSQRQDETAKADFDWAMARLRRAVETFTPSANIGLRMKRELSYELIPPDASQPLYTAQVIVKSKTAYQPERFFPALDDDEEEEQDESSDQRTADMILAEELRADGENDSTVIREDYQEDPLPKTMIVESLVAAPSSEERVVYNLVYRNNRWQLETQPDSKHEKMWFEYALRP